MNYTIETEVEVTTIQKVAKEVSLEQYVGYKILKAREAKGLNISQLVDKIDKKISITHLTNIEKGLLTTRLKDMQILSEALDIHISTLFPCQDTI